MKIPSTFKTRMLCMAALMGMAVALGSCSSEEIAQGNDGKTTETETDKNLTTFVAGEPDTRTTMSSTGVFKWEAGDKIWVKDDNNIWQQSSNAPDSETASFKFKVPGTFTASSSYTVYYPGKNGNQDKVTIPAAQTQPTPNNPSHVGASGDCGWATATAGAGTKQFNFTIDHKAAFLVFSPYTTNTFLNNSNVKLTKIEVNSDNNLVGTYTLDPVTNQLTGTGSGKQINLTTKGTGGSATENGFSVPTAATPSTNASYVVIKPGTHTLRVRFWLKDYVTNVEGTVTKTYPSWTYAANTYYPMSSELKIKDYPGSNYYMWDAQKPYWYGHEWDKTPYTANTDQPTVNGQNGYAYPKWTDADRYYNPTITGVGEGTHGLFNPSSIQHVPNANEMSWYCMKGDPRWDGELWTAMGHLYKGGIWLKKKTYISGFSSTVSADGTTDLRTTSKIFINNSISNIGSNPISPSDQDNYFYLPALGYYRNGTLYYTGAHGYYWSSSSVSVNAYHLDFTRATVDVRYHNLDHGFSVAAFE